MSLISVDERPLKDQQFQSQPNKSVYDEIETSDSVYESIDNADEKNEDPTTIGSRIRHLNNGNSSQVLCELGFWKYWQLIIVNSIMRLLYLENYETKIYA